ncbi:unnamed protein product [Musa acuminata subsp. burmannicoides]
MSRQNRAVASARRPDLPRRPSRSAPSTDLAAVLAQLQRQDRWFPLREGRSLFGDAVYLTLATRVGGGGGDKFESLKLERKHPWRPHKTSERLHPKIPLKLNSAYAIHSESARVSYLLSFQLISYK